MTAINWTEHTAREVFDALRSAPRVAARWFREGSSWMRVPVDDDEVCAAIVLQSLVTLAELIAEVRRLRDDCERWRLAAQERGAVVTMWAPVMRAVANGGVGDDRRIDDAWEAMPQHARDLIAASEPKP